MRAGILIYFIYLLLYPLCLEKCLAHIWLLSVLLSGEWPLEMEL